MLWLSVIVRQTSNERATNVRYNIDGLGYFSPTLIVKGKVRPKIPLRDRNRMVHFKDISFRMDKELKHSVGNPSMEMAHWIWTLTAD